MHQKSEQQELGNVQSTDKRSNVFCNKDGVLTTYFLAKKIYILQAAENRNYVMTEKKPFGQMTTIPKIDI